MRVFFYLLGIIVGLYAFYFLSGPLDFAKISKKPVVSVMIRGVLAIGIAVLSMNMWGTAAVIIYHVFAISVIVDILYMIVRFASKRWFHSGLNHFKIQKELCGIGKRIYQLRVIPILTTVFILIYGFFNIHHLIQTNYIVDTNKAIREEGYRVALISDLHFGTIMKEEQLIEACERINAQNPDLIVLCGDIVEEGTSYEALQRGMEILGSLQSNYGIFYVYGNHDLAPYTDQPNFSPAQLEEALINNQIHILKDTVYELNEDLVLIGRDDAAWGRTNVRKSSEELIAGIDKNKYLLLLDHQPVGLEENRMAGVDLQLSGHTHAGQIWPVGVFTELSGGMNYGIRTYDRLNGTFNIIVSSGIAGWGYPIRMGGHSEYVIIDIKK